MVRGTVGSTDEAYVPISVVSNRGIYHDVNFVVDTAFFGALSLSPDKIRQMELVFVESRPFQFADDSLVEFDLFEAVIIWDDIEREVAILSSDGPPSLGMALLHGYRICMDIVDGGEVIIEARA